MDKNAVTESEEVDQIELKAAQRLFEFWFSYGYSQSLIKNEEKKDEG